MMEFGRSGHTSYQAPMIPVVSKVSFVARAYHFHVNAPISDTMHHDAREFMKKSKRADLNFLKI